MILVIDTETTNTLEEPIAFDIGGVVADLEGHIYKTFSYVIADVFLDKELMEVAYYKEKIPQYWEDIKSGKRELKTLRNIVLSIKDIMKEYEIKDVYAYNIRFDKLATNFVERYLTSSKYRYFFPYGTEFKDILKIARDTLKGNEDYKKFCHDNDYLDSRGHNRHTAEIVYRYLFDNEFTEEHTAKEDSVIEYAILLKCLEMCART